MPKRIILLVEDEAVVAAAEAEMLRENGYAVTIARSGQEAVEMACKDPSIELVLMDIKLGAGMDGADAARNILARREMPILFLSGHTEAETVARTDDIASYGYVLKGSGDVAILASLKTAFRLYDSARSLEERHCLQSRQYRILSDILENTHMMAAYLNSSFDFVWVNNSYAVNSGHEPSYFPGKNHFALYPNPENEAIFQRVVDTGEPFFVEARPFINPEFPERGVTYWDWSLFPITGSSCAVEGLIFTLADVTGRIHAEKKMKLLADMVDGAPASITVHDFEGNFLYANEATFQMHGFSREEFMSIKLDKLDVQESAELIAKRFQEIEAKGWASFESSHYKKDGSSFPLFVTVKKIDWDGAPVVMSIARDITDRKLSEELLRKGAEEKGALLRELQHRIKNTFAMIVSLVNIETKNAATPDAHNALDNIKSRIITLADLYSMLYDDGTTGLVRLGCYLRRIADSLLAAYSPGNGKIKLDIISDEILVKPKIAGSIGLIVNELLMNSLKYAFNGDRIGHIEMSIERTDEGMMITVTDNGAGLPDGFDPSRSEGLGLKLVSLIVDQLGGSLSYAAAEGTTFTVRIPLES